MKSRISHFLASDIRVGLLALCLAMVFWSAGAICGRAGVTIGRVSDALFFWLWPLAGIFFVTKTAQAWRKARQVSWPCIAGTVIASLGLGWALHTMPFLEGFEISLKRAYDTKEVQSWALRALSEPGPLRILKPAEYPNWVSGTRFPRPHSIGVFTQQAGSTESYVKIAWGNRSLGSWGLVVGSPNLSKHGRLWAPGVYFFVSPKPWAWRE